MPISLETDIGRLLLIENLLDSSLRITPSLTSRPPVYSFSSWPLIYQRFMVLLEPSMNSFSALPQLIRTYSLDPWENTCRLLESGDQFNLRSLDGISASQSLVKDDSSRATSNSIFVEFTVFATLKNATSTISLSLSVNSICLRFVNCNPSLACTKAYFT